MKRRIIATILALILILSLSTITSFGEQKITVYLDNQQMTFDTDPIIENGRTLVPMRAIFEALGMTVEWDQSTRTVYAVGEAFYCTEITIDQTKAYRYQLIAEDNNWNKPFNEMQKQDTVELSMDTPARIVNGRTLVPLRFVAESLGCMVNYDAAMKRIDIITGSEDGSTGDQATPSSSSQALDIDGVPISVGDTVKAYTPTLDIFIGDVVEVNGDQIKVEWYDILDFFNISQLSYYRYNPTDFATVQFMGGITFDRPQWIDAERVTLDD